MDVQNIKEYCERQLEKAEQVVGFDRSDEWYSDQLRLRQLWLSAYQNDTLDVIAGTLIEMSEKGKEDEEEDHEPSEGFKAFDAMLEHGLELHLDYEDTYKGQQEIAALSPELRDILGHYRTAASLWANGMQLEELEEVVEKD